MNNTEKFKEVFGLDLAPSLQTQDIPCIFHSKYCINGWSCDGCQLQNFWTREYNPELCSEKAVKKAKKSEIDKYHTCGSCKFEYCPEYKFPCSGCIHCDDIRPDLWEAKEDE